MSWAWIVVSGVLAVAAFVIAVVLKRSFGIAYDKRSLRAILFALVVIALFYAFGDLAPSVFEETDIGKKIAWSFIYLAAFNAVIQYVLWFLWATTRRFELVKLPRFVFNLIILFLIIGMLLYILKVHHGRELTGLLVTSTVLSAVIGLALQDTLGNLISGISLQVESPFAIDDWVNLGGFEGKVMSQNWRTLTLLTRDHHRVSLTNRFIAEDKIVNYSRPSRRQIHNFSIVLDYQHPPNHVKKVLWEMLRDIEEVKPHATLGAYVQDYMDSGIQYGMKYWLEDYGFVNEVHDIVLSRLWYTLKRHNIKIPYPISELQVHVDEAEAKTSIAGRHLSDKKAFLQERDWLQRLSDDQLDALAKAATLEDYGNDDVIIHQGEDGDAMFVVMTGNTKVYLNTDDNKLTEVADKGEGGFIGEMSLLTGEPRSATVKADGDVQILRIGKEAFASTIMQDEKLLEQMIEGMKQYKSGLARIIEEERKKRDTTTESATIIVLQKIKRYLAIS